MDPILLGLAAYSLALSLGVLVSLFTKREKPRKQKKIPLELMTSTEVMRKLDMIEREAHREVRSANRLLSIANDKVGEYKDLYLKSERRADNLARQLNLKKVARDLANEIWVSPSGLRKDSAAGNVDATGATWWDDGAARKV